MFKHKYLTNPLVTPEGLVIASAENVTRALEISISQHLGVSTIQALKDLSEVFTDAFYKYSNDPTIHMPNAPPSHPHLELTESPRVSPTLLGSPPPRVRTITISPTSPRTLPTHAPTSVQISLFPLDVPSVSPWQITTMQQLGTALRLPTNISSISHLEIPTPTTQITCQIMPHVPFPPTHKTPAIPMDSQPGDIG